MRLEIDGLSFGYDSDPILEGVTFSLEKGDVVAILGPNGAGKTTLLSCIDRILKPQKGCVKVDGEDIFNMSRKEAAKNVALVSQHWDMPHIRVFESVLLGRKPHIMVDASNRDLTIVQRVIALMEIDWMSMKYMDELSGGEAQLVQIARAISQEPKVLLLDEPTSNLDMSNQNKVLDTLVNVVKGNEMVALTVIHDVNLAISYADRFILLKDGLIYAAGDSSVLTPENIKAVYNVDAKVVYFEDIPMIIPINKK